MENKRPDADRRHSACGLRAVDRMAMRIGQLLPESVIERTRDIYQFTVRDPGGLVVVVTPEAVEFRLPTVDWTSECSTPLPVSRPFKRLRTAGKPEPVDAKLDGKLDRLIQETRHSVSRNFVSTPAAKKHTPPEHGVTLDGEWTCHGCAGHNAEVAR
jgi:hypothetical protein